MHLLSSSLQCSSNWPIARIGVHWSAFNIWSDDDDDGDDDNDDDDSDYDDNGEGGDDECEVLMLRKRRTKADAADDNKAVCIGLQ